VAALSLDRPAAVLFDLDGTLVHSEPVHRAAWHAFFARRGWEVDDRTYREHFVGRRGDDVFRTLDGPWRDQDPVELLEEVLAELPRVEAVPEPVLGAVRLVQQLHAAGVPVALVTSAVTEWVDQTLGDVLDVAHLFEVVVSAADVERG
jgi:sugar-phosphatase